MLHLLKYSFLSKIRNFNIVFWPLVFPLVLGTFFYFAFGNINEADFQTVPVAVVKEASADTFFMTYLDEVEKSSPDLLKAEEMSEKEALEALQDKKVEGIYYVGKETSLTRLSELNKDFMVSISICGFFFMILVMVVLVFSQLSRTV